MSKGPQRASPRNQFSHSHPGARPPGLTAGPPPWLELEGCSLLAWPVRTLSPPLPGLGDCCSHGAVYPLRSSRGKALCWGGAQKCFNGPCIKQTPRGQAAEEAADMTILLRQECAGQEAWARQGAPPAGCTQRPRCLQGGWEAVAYPRAALCRPCRHTVTPASRLCWMQPCWGWGPERLADTPQQEGVCVGGSSFDR